MYRTWPTADIYWAPPGRRSILLEGVLPQTSTIGGSRGTPRDEVVRLNIGRTILVSGQSASQLGMGENSERDGICSRGSWSGDHRRWNCGVPARSERRLAGVRHRGRDGRRRPGGDRGGNCLGLDGRLGRRHRRASPNVIGRSRRDGRSRRGRCLVLGDSPISATSSRARRYAGITAELPGPEGVPQRQ